jgi:hypothetical protein
MHCGYATSPFLVPHRPDCRGSRNRADVDETDILLRGIRAECVAVIERLRDPIATALTKRDTSLAFGKARADQIDLAAAESEQICARFGVLIWDELSPEQMDQLESEPPRSGWRPRPIEDRDECDAMWAAVPDLLRLARYERRACSRRKRAIARFIELKALRAASVDATKDRWPRRHASGPARLAERTHAIARPDALTDHQHDGQ